MGNLALAIPTLNIILYSPGNYNNISFELFNLSCNFQSTVIQNRKRLVYSPLTINQNQQIEVELTPNLQVAEVLVAITLPQKKALCLRFFNQTSNKTLKFSPALPEQNQTILSRFIHNTAMSTIPSQNAIQLTQKVDQLHTIYLKIS